ncbi:WD40-repeat-containing domain protein [Mycena vulgaris]|nr:WD40-repeat-containing domain protein [Mycena vulgaris]
MATYSQYRALTPAIPDKADAVNSLLFFDNGKMLASGGDDQVLRIWDVISCNCQQEVHNPNWGQILNLSLLEETAAQPTVLFVGSARGVLSLLPWNLRTQQFNVQASSSVAVFPYDTSVESQAVDSLNFRLVVASVRGQIKMYNIKDRKSLALTWKLSVGDAIPRSVAFLGTHHESLAVHLLDTGHLLHYDSRDGKPIAELQRLRGGVGFVAFSPQGAMKAVHNLEFNRYDLYSPADSAPVTVSPKGSARKIKGACFAEDGRVLACGGDEGLIYIHDLAQDLVKPNLQHAAKTTICALTTCTTKDFYLIASGDGDAPATIYIWAKPTETKQADDLELELEQQRLRTLEIQEANARALANQTIATLSAEKASEEGKIRKLTADVDYARRSNLLLIGFLFLFVVLLALSWAGP